MTTAAEWLMSANTGSTGPTAESIAAAVWAHATRVITGPTANDNADALLARAWP